MEKKNKKTIEALMPSPSLLSKLGSIIVHYQEFTSKGGHPLDKKTADLLLEDDEVKKWMKQMNELAFLPLKRTP